VQPDFAGQGFEVKARRAAASVTGPAFERWLEALRQTRQGLKRHPTPQVDWAREFQEACARLNPASPNIGVTSPIKRAVLMT